MDIRVKTKEYDEASKLHTLRCKGRERERLEDQLVEEMGELQVRIMQRRRNRGKDEHILEEMADSIICIYALVRHLQDSPLQATTFSVEALNGVLEHKTRKWLEAEKSGQEPKMSSGEKRSLLD